MGIIPKNGSLELLQDCLKTAMESEKHAQSRGLSHYDCRWRIKTSPHQLAYQISLDCCKPSGKFPSARVNRSARCFRIGQFYEDNKGVRRAQEATRRVSVDIVEGGVTHLFAENWLDRGGGI